VFSVTLPGNGFHLRTVPFLWVPELSPCLSYQLPTSHNCSSQLTQLLKVRFTVRLAVYRRSVRLSVKPLETQSQSYVTTYGQSASLSWNKVSLWGLRPGLYYCQTVAGLLIWGAHSDERTGLSFVSMYNLRFTSY
jgi:hypothetical protein